MFQTFFIAILLPTTASALILNSTTRSCSKHCESINCQSVHKIRYGKFCGVGYSGCPNQSPCDRLDACCKQHDLCVGRNAANFPNHTCRYNLRSCLQQYLSTGAVVYQGSNCTAMTVQNTVMVALESTTFHEHVAPGSAPQAGGAPNPSSGMLIDRITSIVLICGVWASLLWAHELSPALRSVG